MERSRYFTKKAADKEASRRLVSAAKRASITKQHSSGNARLNYKAEKEYLWYKIVETTR